MPFADRLKQLREAAGLSRQELSDLCGLGRGTVRDYEQGRREPSLAAAFKMADALGASVEEFRDQEEPRRPPPPRGVEEVLDTHFPKRRKASRKRSGKK